MPASMLLDRERELESLEGLLDDAEREAGRLMVIEGAPGIGKTSLLNEARRRAVERGLTVIYARASELEQSFAFGVVHQLFDAQLRTDGASHELMAGAARLAEPVFAHHRSAGPLDDPSYSVLHGLYWLTANLAQRKPLLLLLDDAQWADGPSSRFLHFLAQRLEGMAIGMAVATREQAEGFGLDRGEVPLAPAGMPIRPSALTTDAVREVVLSHVGEQATEDLCEACAEATGGNPLLLQELLRDLGGRAEAGDTIDSASIGTFGLGSINTVVLERVRRVDGAWDLARAVAIIGEGADLADVATLTEMDPGEAAQIADTLAVAGIFEPDLRLTFLHPIVRIAIYDAISPAERGELHLRAARLAAARGDPPNTVAAHLLHAGPRGDPDVVARMREVARTSVAIGAPDSAIDWLRRALAEPPTEKVRPAVLFELGSALSMVGSPAAVELLQQSLKLTSDADGRAKIALVLTEALQHAGEIALAVEVLETALSGLPDDDVVLAPRLKGRLLPLACTAVSGKKLVGKRLSDASEDIDRLAPEHARVVLGSVAYDRATGANASASAAADLARQALADGYLLSEESADPVFAVGAVNALFLTGSFAEAERAFETLLGNAQRSGSGREFAMFSAMRSWCRFLSGALNGAEVDARACLALSADTSWFVLNPLAAAVLGSIWLERGEPAKAREAVAPYEALRDDDDSGFAQLLHISRARIRLAEGDARGALEALRPCIRFENGWGENPGIACLVPWRSAAAITQLALGDRSAAVALADEQLSLAREFGAPRAIGEALCVLGRSVDPIRGVELLEEAVKVLDGTEASLEHSRALIEWGAALRRLGKRSRARPPLSAGMDLAYRVGAAGLAAQSREELVTAGARPRRLALSGPDSLTASERRVCEMAVRGMTNREIAQALFVTLRTVEGHLTNAFRKLEISSRDELPRTMGAE